LFYGIIRTWPKSAGTIFTKLEINEFYPHI
jgi:hypothetical protein